MLFRSSPSLHVPFWQMGKQDFPATTRIATGAPGSVTLRKSKGDNRFRRSGHEVWYLGVLGSGSIITQFAEHGLIDRYEFMIDPVVISNGTPLFNGINNNLQLKLTGSQVFKSGVVLLTYQPINA